MSGESHTQVILENLKLNTKIDNVELILHSLLNFITLVSLLQGFRFTILLTISIIGNVTQNDSFLFRWVHHRPSIRYSPMRLLFFCVINLRIYLNNFHNYNSLILIFLDILRITISTTVNKETVIQIAFVSLLIISPIMITGIGFVNIVEGFSLVYFRIKQYLLNRIFPEIPHPFSVKIHINELFIGDVNWNIYELIISKILMIFAITISIYQSAIIEYNDLRFKLLNMILFLVIFHDLPKHPTISATFKNFSHILLIILIILTEFKLSESQSFKDEAIKLSLKLGIFILNSDGGVSSVNHQIMTFLFGLINKSDIKIFFLFLAISMLLDFKSEQYKENFLTKTNSHHEIVWINGNKLYKNSFLYYNDDSRLLSDLSFIIELFLFI